METGDRNNQYDRSVLGAGCGSSPTPQCEAPARQTSENTKSIADMADEFTRRSQQVIDEHEEVVESALRDELCRTICRAEEQGYRIGFDAARENEAAGIKVLVAEIASLRKDIEQQNKALAYAQISLREYYDMEKKGRRETQELQFQVSNLQARLAAETRAHTVRQVIHRKRRSFTGAECLEVLQVCEVHPTLDGLIVFVC